MGVKRGKVNKLKQSLLETRTMPFPIQGLNGLLFFFQRITAENAVDAFPRKTRPNYVILTGKGRFNNSINFENPPDISFDCIPSADLRPIPLHNAFYNGDVARPKSKGVAAMLLCHATVDVDWASEIAPLIF